MKAKKLLLALPMVAIMAGCSARIDVYRDIFKDARALSDEIKDEAREEVNDYAFSGTKTIRVFEGQDELTNKNYELYAAWSRREDDGDKQWYAYYKVDEDYVIDITYDENGNFVWEEGGCPDQSLNAQTVYNKFGELVFSWAGNIETGDFATAPYAYNTTLLNAVSPKCRVLDNKKTSAENFKIQMTGGSAVIKNGKITTTVLSYDVTYSSRRITDFSLAYRYTFEGVEFSVSYVISGSFEYNNEIH